MTREEALAMLERIHHRFITAPRYWYLTDIMAADNIICSAASELRLAIRKGAA